MTTIPLQLIRLAIEEDPQREPPAFEPTTSLNNLTPAGLIITLSHHVHFIQIGPVRIRVSAYLGYDPDANTILYYAPEEEERGQS